MNAATLVALVVLALAARAQDEPAPPPIEVQDPDVDAPVEPPGPADAPVDETAVDEPRAEPGVEPAGEPAVQQPAGGGAAAAQDPEVPAEGAAIDGAAAEPAPARFDFTRELDAEALAAELVRIATEHDGLVSIASIGKTRAGRDILLATVGDRRSGDPDRRPAVFVTADLAAEDAPRAGAQAGLFVVAELVERARQSGRVAELLRRATVYVVAAPDPDALLELVLHDPARIAAEPISASMRLEGEGALRRVGLNRNFPVGWQPYPDGAATSDAHGPYPLCEPESLALARCLLERRNVAATVVATRRAGGLAGCDPDVAGHDALRRLDLADELERALCARSAFADEPGSLPAFTAARLASPAFFAPAWDGPARDASGAAVVETALGRAPAGFAHALELVLTLLSELPRIEPGEADVERLRPDLWQVDLSLSAAGALCVTPLGPRPVEGLWVSVKGGEIELVALRHADETAFRPVDAARPAAGDAQRVEHGLGTLESGAPVALRLVVRAAPATRLELSFGSSSAGGASVLAVLE